MDRSLLRRLQARLWYLAVVALLALLLLAAAGGDGQGNLSMLLTLAPSIRARHPSGDSELGTLADRSSVSRIGSISLSVPQPARPLVVETRLGESAWQKEMGCVPPLRNQRSHPAPGTCGARLITQVYLAP